MMPKGGKIWGVMEYYLLIMSLHGDGWEGVDDSV